MPLHHSPHSIGQTSRSRDAVSLSTAHLGLPAQSLRLVWSQHEPTLEDLEDFLAALAAQEDRWEDAIEEAE